MPVLTKVDISFSLPVPTILVGVAIRLVLLYRRLRYGYTFRRIKLTRGQYAIVDVEDFEQLNQYKWQCSCYGYATRSVTEANDLGSRQVDVYMHKVLCPTPEGMVTDHVNRNKLDNRKANLRPATRKQNNWNRSPKTDNRKTRYHGISWKKDVKKWRVRLAINGKSQSFGSYSDEIEAARAYDRVAKQHRGPFAVLNFPEQ